ncbi:MAG: GNAT family N-acetyltransferase [bacterium]|nr:GNAT family N-acetyltransferase [bacterium]
MPVRELPLSVLPKLAGHFPGPRAEMALAAIEEGNTAAKLWGLGDPPNSVMLWDQGNNVLYPAGPVDDLDGSLAELAIHLAQILPADGSPWFKFVVPDQEWDAAMHRALRGIEFRRAEYVIFDFPQHQNPPDLPLPPGLELRFINMELLDDESLAGREPLRHEIEWMWPDLDSFARRGAGVCVVKGGEILGWCTAEYMSTAACGIGIEVAESAQDGGLGTILAASFLHVARKLNVTPYWECAESNKGSVRIARKLGFRERERINFQIGRF